LIWRILHWTSYPGNKKTTILCLKQLGQSYSQQAELSLSDKTFFKVSFVIQCSCWLFSKNSHTIFKK
jgi:hypothetical protein